MFLGRCCTPQVRLVSMFVSAKMTSSASTGRSHFVCRIFRTRCYCLARRERWFTNVAAPLLPVFRVVASVHAWHRFGTPVQFVFGQLVSWSFTLATSMFCSRWMGLNNQIAIRNSSLRMIPDLLGWKLDAGKAVTNANVFVALHVQIRYVNGSRTMFFM